MKKRMLFIAIAAIMLFVPSVMAAEVKDITSLKECLNTGGTCKVTDNIDATTESTITISKDVNLDLNGKTLKALLMVTGKDTVLTINSSETGGKLIGNTDSGYSAITVDSAKLVLNSGTIVNEGSYGVYCKNGATAIVNGGAITSHDSALSGNNTTGTMYFEINGGTLTTEAGMSIYMPNQVSLKVTDGTLNGGISVRMGTITISGGTINAFKGTEEYPIDKPEDYYSFSGNVWLPDGISVFGGTYTSDAEEGNKLNLTITGGTINVDNKLGSAVAIYDFGKVKQDMKISITGGKFTTASTTRNAYDVLTLKDIGVSKPKPGYGVVNNLVTTSITGGSFNTDVTKFVADKYTVNKTNNTYTVVENKILENNDEKVILESEEGLNKNYYLEVTAKAEEEFKKTSEKIIETYKDNKKVKDTTLIALYDINVVDGIQVVPMENGKFTISISISESMQKFETYKAFYIDNDGKIAEILDAKLENGKVVFTTTHLSTYGVLGYNNIIEENPKTSDINLALILGIIGIASAGIVISLKMINLKING